MRLFFALVHKDTAQRTLETAEKEAAKDRQDEARKRNGGANLAPPKGKARDKVAAFTGMGRTSLDKAARAR